MGKWSGDRVGEVDAGKPGRDTWKGLTERVFWAKWKGWGGRDGVGARLVTVAKKKWNCQPLTKMFLIKYSF